MCTVIYKKLQYPLQWQKKINLSVKCVCIKVSKTPYSSLIQLKKYTDLECLAQILSFHKEIWASSLVSTMKSSLKDHLLNVCKLLESQFFSWYCFSVKIQFQQYHWKKHVQKCGQVYCFFSLGFFFIHLLKVKIHLFFIGNFNFCSFVKNKFLPFSVSVLTCKQTFKSKYLIVLFKFVYRIGYKK